ncbi:hypothetical protein A3A67_05655 [Candidatus Peribacteria bacterium RIFCSPLOWO2_01_FULL_51_18]|nr:MAG: hypothetical protein A3C52_03175 [Candidatus Peribacteria bacterium RIFCSPHIGHO2_02_FULL_51_15]OGJ66591.1 MAG: hypothetical protein A3A67_05655 [Candidatus Peribacteria bacterium RIFCSPLOWO2_01_FULL_51_18]
MQQSFFHDWDRKLIWSGILLIAGFLAINSVSAAFPVPPNDGFVTDTAGLLSSDQEQSIEAEIGAYRRETSNEIAVAIIKNLQGSAIEEAGLEIGRKWGIGAGQKNNGILMLIAYEERQVRIEVGYGLEGAVPDIVAKGIVEMDMIPKFRDGDYGGAITAALDSLKKHIGGEYKSDRYAVGEGEPGLLPYVFFVLFILLQGLIAVMARSKTWWLGGIFGGAAGVILTVIFGWWLTIPFLVFLGLLIDFIVSKHPPRGGRGGFFGGGFRGGRSGGGFGGFGGGSFGGGGASGRW